MLARNKLSSIESKISEALINNEISHEHFVTIIMKKKLSRIGRKPLEWWIVKEVILKKNYLIGESKK